MKSKKRIGRKLWIALIVVVVFQILCDPLSSLLNLGESVQAQIGLPYARRKWESQGIAHYKFDIRGYVPHVCIIGDITSESISSIIRTVHMNYPVRTTQERRRK